MQTQKEKYEQAWNEFQKTMVDLRKKQQEVLARFSQRLAAKKVNKLMFKIQK